MEINIVSDWTFGPENGDHTATMKKNDRRNNGIG
jgi:hypothetical protein